MNNNNFHIRVAIRTRPLLASDYQRISNQAQGLSTAVHVIGDNNSILIVDPVTTKPTHQFFFDKVFHPEETTEEVYNIVAKHIVYHAVKGYNGTVFCYGQTSTGKTHTIFGHSHSSPGIVSLAIEDLFAQIEAAGKSRHFFVRLAVLEIYNERLTDLAQPYDVKQQQPGSRHKPLRIRETSGGFIFVENLIEEVCTNRESALNFLNECLTRRHMAQTLANRDSSRSHVICRIVVESRPAPGSSRPSTGDTLLDYDQAPTTIGELNFVDLAGSECAVKIMTPTNTIMTGSLAGGNTLPPETVVRLKEGRAINRSLLMLGIVINQLSESRQIVNYRNSKLTRILQNALGGNSLTAIICTISPTEADKRQTVSTLQFASNAKSIRTKPRLNETFSADAAVLRRLQLEIERLRRRIVELEMQQSFSASHAGSSTTERQKLHENERILLDMIATGGRKKSQPSATSKNDNKEHPDSTNNAGLMIKPPTLSRRMTWAPTGSGRAVLMFTDNKDRPESRLSMDNGVVHGDESSNNNGGINKPIIFHGVLEKVTSPDAISSSISAEVPSSSADDSRSDSQESSLFSPIKPNSGGSNNNDNNNNNNKEPISVTLDRIENEDEFRERFVGRQYFDTVARNYEKLKNVIEQSLGASINEEDNFSDVSDKISNLVAKSRQGSQISSAVGQSRTITPAAAVAINENVEIYHQVVDQSISSSSPQGSGVPIIPVIRRAAVSARLPPISLQQSSLWRTRSAIGGYCYYQQFNNNNSPRPTPVSRSSTITLTDNNGAKRLALIQQGHDQQIVDGENTLIPENNEDEDQVVENNDEAEGHVNVMKNHINNKIEGGGLEIISTVAETDLFSSSSLEADNRRQSSGGDMMSDGSSG